MKRRKEARFYREGALLWKSNPHQNKSLDSAVHRKTEVQTTCISKADGRNPSHITRAYFTCPIGGGGHNKSWGMRRSEWVHVIDATSGDISRVAAVWSIRRSNFSGRSWQSQKKLLRCYYSTLVPFSGNSTLISTFFLLHLGYLILLLKYWRWYFNVIKSFISGASNWPIAIFLPAFIEHKTEITRQCTLTCSAMTSSHSNSQLLPRTAPRTCAKDAHGPSTKQSDSPSTFISTSGDERRAKQRPFGKKKGVCLHSSASHFHAAPHKKKTGRSKQQ